MVGDDKTWGTLVLMVIQEREGIRWRSGGEIDIGKVCKGEVEDRVVFGQT